MRILQKIIIMPCQKNLRTKQYAFRDISDTRETIVDYSR